MSYKINSRFLDLVIVDNDLCFNFMFFFLIKNLEIKKYNYFFKSVYEIEI